MKAWTVGTSVDPSTTSWAPLAATAWAGALYAESCSGNVSEYTERTPMFDSSVWASWTGGSANGSRASGKAAVFGRWLGGSEADQLPRGDTCRPIGRAAR